MRLIDEEKGFSWGPSIGSNRKKHIYYMWANNIGKKENDRIASYNFYHDELRIGLCNEIDFTKVPLNAFVEYARNDYMKGRYGIG